MHTFDLGKNKCNIMAKNIIYTIVVLVAILIGVQMFHSESSKNLKLEKLRNKYSKPHKPSVNHSKLAILQQDFKTPQEVTMACLSCHTEVHKELMKTAHWNWERVSYIEGRGVAEAGKRNILNNYCIGAVGNELACAKCHIGFGMEKDKFDFTDKQNIDCMVCHDNSNSYIKGNSMAGYPAKSVDLRTVAQKVGMPLKSNCGSCHFYSGGGNNVKHGDLEEAQLACTRELDVHMAANGMNMECVACHTAENHEILGKMYTVSSDNTNRATCEQCHTNTPHISQMLNKHTDKIACQTCHIPHYAKENATKMRWNWSDAGRLKDGKPFHEEDAMGNHSYLSIKGSFVWEKNVKPEYLWFNGTADHYLLGDTVSVFPIQMNKLFGSCNDGESKIIPVKVHRGNQIYDPITKMLIQPRLFRPQKGDSAYWQDFNWHTAATAGMADAGLPFSGKYEFVETEMYWPLNHMVSPKENALKCAECHTRSDNGRLANLKGFYLPGRDNNKWIDNTGKFLLIISLIGVITHAFIRILFGAKNRKTELC